MASRFGSGFGGNRSQGPTGPANFRRALDPLSSSGISSSAATGPTASSSSIANANLPNYLEEKAKCVSFLQNFTSNLDDETRGPKYLRILQEVANRERKAVSISLDDIYIYEKDDEFVGRIIKNTRRYVSLFAEAIDEILPAPTQDISTSQDVLDVLRLHRAQELQRRQQIQPANQHDDPLADNGANALAQIGSTAAAAINNNNPNASVPQEGVSQMTTGSSITTTFFPPALMRRFEVCLVPGVKMKAVPIRQVKASKVGSLVRIRGMVTRVSNVKPLLSVATYTCETCAYEVYQEVKSRQFTPLVQCPSERCRANRQNGRLVLQTKACRFEKYQEVKFQELPDQVPMGHIPRSLTVYLRGELTRTCEPGALITICGIFLPLPTTAQRQMQMGLLTETYLEAMDVVNHKKRYSCMESDEDMEQRIMHLQESSQDLYQLLSQSIAPEIYGHEDVKKALLLLMIGGVTKQMDEGMKLRGDINILLMGDPGVAKSQLLKHIATIAPRGVYTTGKGSSGVGLTAAVVRDTMTKEMTLEGGALVLADRGICAIDEFDKMEEGDRTAIHEVMEQQTVSIAKAGITTTLNARTSVLAAANPVYGRYNRKLSASQNINLPNALLSRFDLIFVLLDTANYEKDEALARHVTHVHRYCRNPAMQFEPVAPELLRYFIAIAKQYTPSIPENLCGYIVEAYVTLRQQDVTEQARQNGIVSRQRGYGAAMGNENQAQTAMTARQLLSILRLSQALARLRFSTEVIQQDVDEAIRLVYVSKASLTDGDEMDNGEGAYRGYGNNARGADATSKIYRMVLEYVRDRNLMTIPFSDVEPMVLRKGFTSQQLLDCIEYYTKLDVMQLSANGTTLHFIM